MKKRMKGLQILGIVLVCCVVLALAVVVLYENPKIIKHDNYDVIKEKGRSYISVHANGQGSKETENVGEGYQIVRSSPAFSSVEEMKQTIEKGELTPELVASIAAYDATDGVWEICDLDNLHDVCLPDSVTVSKVVLRGIDYKFSLESDSFDSGYLLCCGKSSYDEKFLKEYQGFPDEQQEVTDEKVTEERNATITYYKNYTGEYKCIKYAIQQNEWTLYVIETYILYMRTGLWEESEVIPRKVTVFAEGDGVYYKMWISKPTERPSVEWLKSIELVPLDD